MLSVPKLAASIHRLYTEAAERVGLECKFSRRQRCVSASAFVQSLVFEWMADPTASLASVAARLGVTAEALRRRCGRPVKPCSPG